MKRGLVAVALLLSLLTACAGNEPTGQASLDPETTSTPETPSVAPSTSQSASAKPSSGPPDKVGVHRRKITVRNAGEGAVVTAFVSYVTVRLTAYNTLDVDLDALAKVAAGKALATVRTDVASLRDRKQHTVGEVWVDVPKVTVSGRKASLTACMVNTTVDVDAKGKPINPPTPFYNIRSTLEKAGGAVWVVTTMDFVGNSPCK